MDDANSPWIDTQELLHLRGGEALNSDDKIASCRGGACLLGKPGAKVGRRIIAADHEKIVERGDSPAMSRVHPLVERVKDVGGRCETLCEQAAACVAGEGSLERAYQAMRAVAEVKSNIRMGRGEAVQDGPRVDPNAGGVLAGAVGRIQSDFQSASITGFASGRESAAESSASKDSRAVCVAKMGHRELDASPRNIGDQLFEPRRRPSCQ